MDRARDAAQSADVVVFVVDGTEPPTVETREAIGRLDGARALVVVNKVDLPPGAEWPTPSGAQVVWASAETGEGLDDIRDAMLRLVRSDDLTRMARDRAILNARLASLLEGVRQPLADLGGALGDRESLELLAARAREILSYYEEATGRRYRDDLLDVIFSRFCIGK
jgi:tRNA modification GTPase